jgi:hypothetical protein
LRKIDNFLPSRPGPAIVFQKGRQARLALSVRGARPGLLPLRTGDDSEMAPQAIEIAQNSEIAIHGIAIVKHKNRLGEFRMS